MEITYPEERQNMDEIKEQIRIAVVVDSYVRGGVAMALQTFLQLLAEKNEYSITLFIREYAKPGQLNVPDVVVCCPFPEGNTFSLWNRGMILANWRNYGRKQIYKARCRKMFPGEYDCAIAYQMISNDVTVAVLEKIQAKRKILWLHGTKNFRQKDLAFYDTLYSGADRIVCVSRDTEKQFCVCMKKCKDKTTTIHNFYDIPYIRSQAQAPAEDMKKKENAITIVSVGRISKEKGFDRVPPVAARLTEEGYDFRWYIIGDGEKREEVGADIRERHLEDAVILLGHRRNPYPYIQQCDIYVQPSYTEGFCTSTMEAKILHKPVVTTDVPGMGEQFVSGENGLIVESSEEGLYEGIKRLLDDPELGQRFIENLKTDEVSNETALRQTIAVIEGTDDYLE